jgi:hypothetical protein
MAAVLWTMTSDAAFTQLPPLTRIWQQATLVICAVVLLVFEVTEPARARIAEGVSVRRDHRR